MNLDIDYIDTNMFMNNLTFLKTILEQLLHAVATLALFLAMRRALPRLFA